MGIEHKCGAGVDICEPWELRATALLTSLSNLAILPTLFLLFRHGLHFEVAICIFGLTSSFLYHFCEPTGYTIFGMNDGNWHRLDNIGAIMGFANLFIYFMDNRNTVFNDYLKFGMFCWTLIQQESGPWKLSNTIIPIAGAAVLPIAKHALVFRRLPDYNWRNFATGWGFLAVAIIFFVRGLQATFCPHSSSQWRIDEQPPQDETDYLRSAHSAWHVVLSVSGYFMWQTLQHKPPHRNR